MSAAAALSLALSPLLWSQAVISEVYALLALFASVLLWLLVRWRDGGSDWLLWLGGLVLGLGLGNHLTLAAVVPSGLVLLWPHRRRWLRLRVMAPAAGMFLVGLCVYLYLPIAAGHLPPVNWGNPQTWDRFVWLVTAKQYRPFVFGLAPDAALRRLATWAQMLAEQFGWWGLALSLGGLWFWYQRDRPFALFTLTWGVLVAVWALFYDVDDSHLYLLPAFLLMATWWGEGALRLLDAVRRTYPRLQWLALAAVAVLPGVSLALNWGASNLSHDWSAHTYSHQVLSGVDPHGLLIVRGDRPTFAAWYSVYAEEPRPDVAVVNGPLLAYIWYRELLRQLYPDLILIEPEAGSVTTDDLVRDLVIHNIGLRPVYATDPGEPWQQWFNFVQQDSGVLYSVQIKTIWQSSG